MVKYNFYNIFSSVDKIISSPELDSPMKNFGLVQNNKICEELAKHLNAFFKDFRCSDVIYTINTDKPFFGIFVKANGFDGRSIATGNITNVTSYQVEIDSRLVTDFGLSATEIATLMLLDINSISGEMFGSVIFDALQAISAYRQMPIDIDVSDKQKTAILNLACVICGRNLTSMFCKPADELLFDIPNFISEYQLTGYYESATRSITARAVNREGELEYPAIMLNWFVSINENDNPNNGRYIKNMLRKALSYEASSLVRKTILVAINALDSEIPSMQSSYLSSLTEAKHGLIAQMKRNGLRSLEDDLYEYAMRLRNVETQDDAILLMRQINSRMSILEDYLRSEPDIDDKERQRWEDCYDKYMNIRIELSKKTVYNKKMYGLFVDYNALQNMSQSGQLMNTYY